MLPVEIEVERVVQVHPADVNAGRAKSHEEKRRDRAAPAKPPAREAVGPNGGQVRGAAQHQQGAPIAFSFGPIQLHVALNETLLRRKRKELLARRSRAFEGTDRSFAPRER